MKQGILIQARTGSTRLPNKIILPFYEEKGILEILIEHLIVLHNEYPIILCTSTGKNDDALVPIAEKYGIKSYRGSENNVLDRFIGAAEKYNLSTVVRICADNPFLLADEPLKRIAKNNRGLIEYIDLNTIYPNWDRTYFSNDPVGYN